MGCYQVMMYLETGRFEPCRCLKKLPHDDEEEGDRKMSDPSLEIHSEEGSAEEDVTKPVEPRGSVEDSPRRKKMTKKVRRKAPRSVEEEKRTATIEEGEADEGDAAVSPAGDEDGGDVSPTADVAEIELTEVKVEESSAEEFSPKGKRKMKNVKKVRRYKKSRSPKSSQAAVLMTFVFGINLNAVGGSWWFMCFGMFFVYISKRIAKQGIHV